MALRMVYDKAMGFAAKQYQQVLGNQLAQYGEYFYTSTILCGVLLCWGIIMLGEWGVFVLMWMCLSCAIK